jgi:ADP-heptose:LPS heptosyltransferase
LELRRDCRHFPGDRPCNFHKETGVTCSECRHFSERGSRVLVVKLDALGDVLRTTSLLPSIKRAYDPSYVTWITSPAALDLFKGNDLVDEVIPAGEGALAALLARDFDIVINPDASAASCAIASAARGGKKYGFILDPRGCVEPLNAAAERWLLMGSFDGLKRDNRKTYQEIIHGICELDREGQHIVLGLTEDEKKSEARMRHILEPGPHGPVIGLNTGAGDRWGHKKWRIDGFISLIDMLLEDGDARVLLLGGPGERERNARIKSHFGARVADGCRDDLRDFVREVDICDVVVTSDTLALHVALGLGKRVVALFGPTSPWEVDLYGLGQKIVPDLDCICCYKPNCERKPNCMDLISARDVAGAVSDELAKLSGEVLVET